MEGLRFCEGLPGSPLSHGRGTGPHEVIHEGFDDELWGGVEVELALGFCGPRSAMEREFTRIRQEVADRRAPRIQRRLVPPWPARNRDRPTPPLT